MSLVVGGMITPPGYLVTGGLMGGGVPDPPASSLVIRGMGTPQGLVTRGLGVGVVTPVVSGPGNPIAAYLFAVRRRHVVAPFVPIVTTAEVWNGNSWDSIAWNGVAPSGALIVLNRRSLLTGRVGSRTSQ